MSKINISETKAYLYNDKLYPTKKEAELAELKNSLSAFLYEMCTHSKVEIKGCLYLLNEMFTHDKFNTIVKPYLEQKFDMKITLKTNTPDLFILSRKELCQKYQIQMCHDCNYVECGDNCNPLKLIIESFKTSVNYFEREIEQYKNEIEEYQKLLKEIRKGLEKLKKE